MRVLVTGGAGFIGSNLVWSLAEQGVEVAVVDDLSTGSVGNLHPAARFAELDILSSDLDRVMRDVAPDVVVHLAAQASVSASIADPARDRQVNAEGTRRVARAAADAGARLVLSASSAAVYGEPAELPLREASPKEPENPYGSSKLEAESLLSDALAASATDFASMRFSNVYGPRQSAAGEGGVVALFCDAIRSGRSPVVYGDGTQTRDFIYVGDVVSFVLAAIGSHGPLARNGDDGAAYNVSTGTETSVNTLLEQLRATSGFEGRVDNVPLPDGDVARSALDPSKAAEIVDWRAAVPLEQGLSETYRWFAEE